MPTAEEIEQSGFALEDFASDPVDVLPDNEPVFLLFEEMATQWRMGMNGPTGLDYNVMYHKMSRMSLSDENYRLMELDIRVLESHALAAMHRK
ncbi:DUF1799 domain-containing protein [Rugamonas aquatica]|uniref:DUF1799 domain-containing protein n=1 Tax=Rugamonas aquatica TaxID=2743357 RepID=A0A6A7N223_9BURK|nr:DUF1799 domain-containing protein [Rugamonas aquatica]MQA39037.1 hypothetical protein [Rugamonas aquatica]